MTSPGASGKSLRELTRRVDEPEEGGRVRLTSFKSWVKFTGCKKSSHDVTKKVHIFFIKFEFILHSKHSVGYNDGNGMSSFCWITSSSTCLMVATFKRRRNRMSTRCGPHAEYHDFQKVLTSNLIQTPSLQSFSALRTDVGLPSERTNRRR